MIRWHWIALTLLWFGVWGFVSAQTPLPAPPVHPPPVDPNEWNWRELVFHSVFFVLIFGVPVFVVWGSYNKTRLSGFDLSPLWKKDDGSLDKLFIIALGTWWPHFCAIVLWTLSRTAITADFVTFMGWGLPVIAQMFAPKPQPSISTLTDVVKPTEVKP